MNKFLYALMAMMFLANPCIAAEDEPGTAVQNQEDAKYEADSEECYDAAEKKFNSDKSNQTLAEEQISEKLDKLFNECMQGKGHKVEEENKETPEE